MRFKHALLFVFVHVVLLAFEDLITACRPLLTFLLRCFELRILKLYRDDLV